MNYIEKRLQELREDYKKYPEHRWTIRLMANVLKMTPHEPKKPTKLYTDIKDALM